MDVVDVVFEELLSCKSFSPGTISKSVLLTSRRLISEKNVDKI